VKTAAKLPLGCCVLVLSRSWCRNHMGVAYSYCINSCWYWCSLAWYL